MLPHSGSFPRPPGRPPRQQATAAGRRLAAPPDPCAAANAAAALHAARYARADPACSRFVIELYQFEQQLPNSDAHSRARALLIRLIYLSSTLFKMLMNQ